MHFSMSVHGFFIFANFCMSTISVLVGKNNGANLGELRIVIPGIRREIKFNLGFQGLLWRHWIHQRVLKSFFVLFVLLELFELLLKLIVTPNHIRAPAIATMRHKYGHGEDAHKRSHLPGVKREEYRSATAPLFQQISSDIAMRTQHYLFLVSALARSAACFRCSASTSRLFFCNQITLRCLYSLISDPTWAFRFFRLV